MPELCLDLELNKEPYYFDLAMPVFKTLVDEKIYKYVDVNHVEWDCDYKEEAVEFRNKSLLNDKGKCLVKMKADIDEWDILHINSVSLTFKLNSI